MYTSSLTRSIGLQVSRISISWSHIFGEVSESISLFITIIPLPPSRYTYFRFGIQDIAKRWKQGLSLEIAIFFLASNV